MKLCGETMYCKYISCHNNAVDDVTHNIAIRMISVIMITYYKWFKITGHQAAKQTDTGSV